ncbi:hypothetical protein [Paenibacillus amylolyticus]|uniref:hypothetical protein n=1 Tax=Paenibacillus amylolyticus TaxID=1451 RepID=UPI003D98EDEE
MKNAKVIFTAWILTACILGGCSSDTQAKKEENAPSTNINTTTTNNEDKYTEYRDQFYAFKENFDPSPQFKLISPDDYIAAGTVSFPDSVTIDKEKTDALTSEVPTKYDLLYKSEKSNMIVKVNFIYMDGAEFKEDSEFITINTISQARNENVIEKYHDLERPMIDEYFLRYKNKLIVINFVEQVEYQSEAQYQKKTTSYVEEQLKFYELFEQELKKSF